jgi:predicted dehydrogenase
MLQKRRDFIKQSAFAGAGILALYPNIVQGKQSSAGKIKIAQIGIAHAHASGKMEALRRFPDQFEVMGVVEADDRLYQQLQDHEIYQGVPRLQLEDLWKSSDLQAVTIETGLDDLLPMALASLQHGLHVHLDKPPGRSMPTFEKVVQTARQNDLVLQMGYMYRYNPAFQFCLKAVQQGWLGDIFEVDGVMSKVLSPEKRREEGIPHGGSMMLLGCHLIDMLVAVLGEPQKVTSFHRQTLSDLDSVYDNELAVYEYPKAISTIRSALLEVEGFERRQFVVCGSKGTVEIKPLEPYRGWLALDKPAGGFESGHRFVDIPENGDRYDEQMLDFVRMIRGKEPEFSYEHDLAVQRTLLKTIEN